MDVGKNVNDYLLSNGWSCGYAGVYVKRIENFAEAGMFSNGARVVTLQLSGNARWLSVVDGWGKIEAGVDMRDFNNVEDAIKLVLDLGKEAK